MILGVVERHKQCHGDYQDSLDNGSLALRFSDGRLKIFVVTFTNSHFKKSFLWDLCLPDCEVSCARSLLYYWSAWQLDTEEEGEAS